MKSSSGSGNLHYASTPGLITMGVNDSNKEFEYDDLKKDVTADALKKITEKYDSCRSLQSNQQQELEVTVDRLQLTEQDRLQVETLFKGLKTQVFVCDSLANLYLSSTEKIAAGNGWELRFTGVPVLLLDPGESKARDRRRIQILLAERGTGFTLWRDTIDNLTSYRAADSGFHTMHMSHDHRQLAGLSFDCPAAAKEFFKRIEELTSRPENICLSVPTARRRKQRRKPERPPPLPKKTDISMPCCFQHVATVAPHDRTRFISLQTFVASSEIKQEK